MHAGKAGQAGRQRGQQWRRHGGRHAQPPVRANENLGVAAMACTAPQQRTPQLSILLELPPVLREHLPAPHICRRRRLLLPLLLHIVLRPRQLLGECVTLKLPLQGRE